MTSRRRKNSIKFCDSIGLEVATLRPNIGLKVATLRPMFRFGKVTHTYLASTSPGLNVVWPQRRLASTSSGLNVVWPHCRWPQRRGLKVAWPQCPIGICIDKNNWIFLLLCAIDKYLLQAGKNISLEMIFTSNPTNINVFDLIDILGSAKYKIPTCQGNMPSKSRAGIMAVLNIITFLGGFPQGALDD